MPNLAWLCILIIGTAGLSHALAGGEFAKALLFLSLMIAGTAIRDTARK
jgi:hypothetical protein